MKVVRFLLDYSEFLLSIMIVLYWYFSGTALNWVAIVLLAILFGLILTKNVFVGIWVPALIILASLYMVLALLSEYSEFPTPSYEAYRLLIVGAIYIGSTLVSAGLVMMKYILRVEHPAEDQFALES